MATQLVCLRAVVPLLSTVNGVSDMKPENVTPTQWQAALSIASSVCDPIRKGGGTPDDALRAFGLHASGLGPDEWHKVHNWIATAACSNAKW
jgi:hypothetical protein